MLRVASDWRRKRAVTCNTSLVTCYALLLIGGENETIVSVQHTHTHAHNTMSTTDLDTLCEVAVFSLNNLNQEKLDLPPITVLPLQPPPPPLLRRFNYIQLTPYYSRMPVLSTTKNTKRKRAKRQQSSCHCCHKKKGAHNITTCPRSGCTFGVCQGCTSKTEYTDGVTPFGKRCKGNL